MKEFLKKWLVTFWGKHGERETFAVQAGVMAICFIIAGLSWVSLKSLVDVGLTILTGIAMLFFNKVRSPEKEVAEPANNEEGPKE